MGDRSRLPRKQRLAVFEAPTSVRRKRMAVLLSRDLRTRYGRRQLPIRKGDTARVIRGSYIGREERVAKVDRRSYSVTLDNITVKTGEAKLKPLPIRTSALVLTRLNLSDPWRRRVLKVPEAESEAEEGGEAAAEPVTETPSAPAAPKPAPAAKETPAAAPAKPPRKRSSAKAAPPKEEKP
ncbi:MAG TPA: 50S ribosomal protein L24 [Thermoplasmata archaeon]|nr:50S ribosomal protein L24 [Thermoplasmata archaeon]